MAGYRGGVVSSNFGDFYGKSKPVERPPSDNHYSAKLDDS